MTEIQVYKVQKRGKDLINRAEALDLNSEAADEKYEGLSVCICHPKIVAVLWSLDPV